MKQIFVIFGKMPQIGFSKTRLAREVGEGLALSLYDAFIKDFSKNLSKTKIKSIYIFGTPDTLDTKEYFFREFSNFNINYFPQSELSFFQRLRELFLKIREVEGECFIHLTGTDIPDFPFEEIEKINPKPNTIYLGPDIDGGFYYVGGEARFFDIFSFIPGENILERISKRIGELGLEVSHLKTWSDIDDLRGLKVTLERSSREKISHTRELWKV
jgi:glycosyltransferase A (GT-A) superfamily protein (DUF2064 family)